MYNNEFELDHCVKELESAAIEFANAVEKSLDLMLTSEQLEKVYKRLRAARQNLLDLFRKVRDG